MDHGRIVLGIGNPGAEYDQTRHNAGFMVLDDIAAREGLRFARLERKGPDGNRRFGGKVKAHVAEWRHAATSETEGDGVAHTLLVKPLTYVNLSGDVAGPLLRIADLSPDQLFVVVDDLNLPLGRIRVRPAGSSGGHNGLKSIEAALGTSEYPRLRLGIGQPAVADSSVDYVLARFLPDERQVLSRVLERCALIVERWAQGVPVETLMGEHNGFDANEAAADSPGET